MSHVSRNFLFIKWHQPQNLTFLKSSISLLQLTSLNIELNLFFFDSLIYLLQKARLSQSYTCECECVYDINQSTSKKPHYVQLMPCYIKHTAMSLWYSSNKTWYAWIHNIIEYNNAPDVVHSPIPQEKQGNNKKTVEVEVGGNKKETWTKFEKKGEG